MTGKKRRKKQDRGEVEAMGVGKKGRGGRVRTACLAFRLRMYNQDEGNDQMSRISVYIAASPATRLRRRGESQDKAQVHTPVFGTV